MDFLVLYFTDKLMKNSARFISICLSATLGAIWSVICLLIPTQLLILEKLVTYFIITPLMYFVILNKNQIKGIKRKIKIVIRRLLKGSITMLLVTFLMSGIINTLRYLSSRYMVVDIVLKDYELLAFVLVTVMLVILIVKHIQKEKMNNMLLRRIEIEALGETFELMAIIDSGNCLIDSVTKLPVTVVEKSCFNRILENIDNLYKLKYHYTAYNCVGGKGGLIEVILADNMHIYVGDEKRSYTNVAIGLSDSRITGDGTYSALLNVAYLNN